MYTLTYARDLVVGDVVNFGELDGNHWRLTDLRTRDAFTGFTAVYVGGRSRYIRPEQEDNGSLRTHGLYRKVA